MNKYIARAVLVGIMASTANIFADSVMLPCRYIVTTSTINTLSGVTTGEKTKAKLLQRNLEVTKYIEDGKPEIKFTAKSKRGTDVSDDAVGSTDFRKKEELLKVLKSITTRQDEQRRAMHPSDSSEKVYADGDVAVTMVASGRELCAELEVGEAIFVLRDRVDIDGLCRIISSLR